jgi:hypothetical protein
VGTGEAVGLRQVARSSIPKRSRVVCAPFIAVSAMSGLPRSSTSKGSTGVDCRAGWRVAQISTMLIDPQHEGAPCLDLRHGRPMTSTSRLRDLSAIIRGELSPPGPTTNSPGGGSIVLARVSNLAGTDTPGTPASTSLGKARGEVQPLILAAPPFGWVGSPPEGGGQEHSPYLESRNSPAIRV